VQGNVDLSALPAFEEAVLWDFVSADPSGFGIAVGRRRADRSDGLSDEPGIFVRPNPAAVWTRRKFQWNPSLWREGEAVAWPTETFKGFAMPHPNLIAMSWGEFRELGFPFAWVHVSHVIYTHDQGRSWGYTSLSDSYDLLGHDLRGNLLVSNNGYFLQSADGREWRKRRIRVAWPKDFAHKKVNLLREVTFVEDDAAYALIVHWSIHREDRPPDIGLLKTGDGGRHWNLLHVFPGPNVGDVNERHVLSLEVADSATS